MCITRPSTFPLDRISLELYIDCTRSALGIGLKSTSVAAIQGESILCMVSERMAPYSFTGPFFITYYLKLGHSDFFYASACDPILSEVKGLLDRPPRGPLRGVPPKSPLLEGVSVRFQLPALIHDVQGILNPIFPCKSRIEFVNFLRCNSRVTTPS